MGYLNRLKPRQGTTNFEGQFLTGPCVTTLAGKHGGLFFDPIKGEIMLKKIGLVVLCLAIISTASFAAPSRLGKLEGGVNVSGILPDEDIDDTTYVGGTLNYGLYEWLAIGGEVGWSDSNIDIDGINLGDLSAVPVLANAIFRFQNESQVVPYGKVGAGVIFFNFDESSLLNTLNIDIDVDDAFAIKIAGGFDWFLNDNTAVNFEIGYLFSEADISGSLAGTSLGNDKINTDHLIIGGGLKFIF